jgi:hypothetical protein
MPKTSNFPEIFQLRVALAELSPHVWRRIVVPSDAPLVDLHQIIQTAFGWSGRLPFRFRIRAKLYLGVLNEAHEGQSNPHPRLADLRLYAKERFQYEYNFGHPLQRLWRMDIRLEKKSLPTEKETGIPQCIGGVGAAPPEDCGGSRAFEQFQNLFTPVYIVHRLAEMLDAGFTTEHIAELRHLRPWMDRDGCNRRSINRRLRKVQVLDSESTGVQA